MFSNKLRSQKRIFQSRAIDSTCLVRSWGWIEY